VRPIASLSQAVRFLGFTATTVWTSLMLLAENQTKPSDLLTIALVRAKMCEQLGHVLVPAATAACFLVGLCSVLDVLRDHPLADILQGLLLAHTGVCGTIMHSVLAYEHGHWEEVRLQSKYGPVGRPVPAFMRNVGEALVEAQRQLHARMSQTDRLEVEQQRVEQALSEKATERERIMTLFRSMLCLCHGSQFDAYPILAEFCLLRRDVNPIQTRGIFAENLALDLQGQIDAVLFFDVVGQLKRHKLLNQPLGRPDGIVAAETQPVWPQPEQ
jgi:hypothetical protein